MKIFEKIFKVKTSGKAEFIVSVIGLFCTCVFFGAIYHFVLGYNISSSFRVLAIQTIPLVILGILIVAVVWVINFVKCKRRR